MADDAVGVQGVEPLWQPCFEIGQWCAVEGVQATGSSGAAGHDTGFAQQSQVSRHGWSGLRESFGDLARRARRDGR
jgi:hypothetical protein